MCAISDQIFFATTLISPSLCHSQAAMGIAELITMAMEKEGLAKQECLKKIWMVDSKGLIVKVHG